MSVGLVVVAGLAVHQFKANGKLVAQNALITQGFDVYASNVQRDAIEQNEQLSQLLFDNQAARDDERAANEVFDGHDLAEIIANKPGVFERLADAATQRLFNEINHASRGGAATASDGGTPAP